MAIRQSQFFGTSGGAYAFGQSQSPYERHQTANSRTDLLQVPFHTTEINVFGLVDKRYLGSNICARRPVNDLPDRNRRRLNSRISRGTNYITESARLFMPVIYRACLISSFNRRRVKFQGSPVRTHTHLNATGLPSWCRSTLFKKLAAGKTLLTYCRFMTTSLRSIQKPETQCRRDYRLNISPTPRAVDAELRSIT